MGRIHVLITDDNARAREDLPRLLDAEGDIKVVGTAKNGIDAFRKVLELEPNIVLMDLKMPVLGGIEATRQIKQRRPDVKVIMLSIYERAQYVTESLRAGASTYVYKGVSMEALADTIRRVHHGASDRLEENR